MATRMVMTIVISSWRAIRYPRKMICDTLRDDQRHGQSKRANRNDIPRAQAGNENSILPAIRGSETMPTDHEAASTRRPDRAAPRLLGSGLSAVL